MAEELNPDPKSIGEPFTEEANTKDPVPIDLSGKPLKRDKGSYVWFESPNGLKIETFDDLPSKEKIVYLYTNNDKEGPVAWIYITPDGKYISKSEIGLDPTNAQRILEENLSFPFRSQLVDAVEARLNEPEELNRRKIETNPNQSSEFNPTPTEVTHVKDILEETINNMGLIIIPEELLEKIAGSEATSSLHISNDQHPGAQRARIMAAKWLTEKGLDSKQAYEYAQKIVNSNNLIVAAEYVNTPEQMRLAYHEIIHRLFWTMRTHPGKETQDTEAKFKTSYFSVPAQRRERFELMMRRSDYKEQEFPEEFWTYYLSLSACPLEESEKKDVTLSTITAKILEIGRSPQITNFTDRLPFLIDQQEIREKLLGFVAKGIHIP